jgi:membrane-bound lytic murein transglycosylase B
MSPLTGIPLIAQRAYGYAELVLSTAMPGCQLRWTTLAAIGQVESNHGSTGGAALLDTGQALPTILGPPLDGTGGNLLIRDTDGGLLDGDANYDRAVGPMQFIPATWYTVVDPLLGISDVNNINDTALAAGYYLCRDGRNLSVGTDWQAAIHSYNDVDPYVNAVFNFANEYGQRSRGGTA